MDVIETYRKDLDGVSLLSRDEEQRLAVAAKHGDSGARSKLVDSQLRWVFRIASKYTGQGVELPDLIQCGNRVLLLCVDRFEPERGIRLSTLVGFSVKRALHQIANRQAKKHSVAPVSIERVPRQMLTDKATPHPEDATARIELIEQVQQAIQSLPPRDRLVIRARMQGRIYRDIGEEIGVSTERVRQITEQAHEKLAELLGPQSQGDQET